MTIASAWLEKAIQALSLNASAQTKEQVNQVLCKVNLLPRMDEKLDAMNDKIDEVCAPLFICRRASSILANTHMPSVRGWLLLALGPMADAFVMCQVLRLHKKKSSSEQIKFRRTVAMSACELPEDRVQVGDFIAQGGQGKVYKASYAGQPAAVKVVMLIGSLLKREKIARDFMSEVDITARLKHPNVTRMYGVITTDPSCLQVVMEYAPDGSLRELLDENPDEPLPSETQMHFIKQLCHGLSYLHEMNVAHKDMKSLNVLRFAFYWIFLSKQCYNRFYSNRPQPTDIFRA
jgi:hypothetical protein